MTEKIIQQQKPLIYQRGERKVKADYKFDDIYKFYKERWGNKTLPKSVVREIYKRLYPAIVKMMVFESFDYRMPARLGYLRVKKKLIEPKIDENGNLDARRLSANWKKTRQYWRELYPNKTPEEIKAIKHKPIVRETNDHTNGYRMVWFWDRTTSNLKNQTAYYIDMSRTNDQILSNGIKYNKNLNFYT
jgi:hypothetical protein